MSEIADGLVADVIKSGTIKCGSHGAASVGNERAHGTSDSKLCAILCGLSIAMLSVRPRRPGILVPTKVSRKLNR
jgi:hypothetical protein